MTLILPLNLNTSLNSFCLFAWSCRELANSLLTLYGTGLNSEIEQGSNDLATGKSLLPELALRYGFLLGLALYVAAISILKLFAIKTVILAKHKNRSVPSRATRPLE